MISCMYGSSGLWLLVQLSCKQLCVQAFANPSVMVRTAGRCADILLPSLGLHVFRRVVHGLHMFTEVAPGTSTVPEVQLMPQVARAAHLPVVCSCSVAVG